MPTTLNTTSRTIYMCMSVRGAINSLHRQRGKKTYMTDDQGRPLTKQQALDALDALMDELTKGHEVIPMGPQCANPCPNADRGCTGFDYGEHGGCPGFCRETELEGAATSLPKGGDK